MLFWKCLVFVWLEIFQVIKKLRTNCCLKICCVYIHLHILALEEAVSILHPPFSESPMSRLEPKLFWSLQSQRVPLSDASLFLITFYSLQETIWGGCARNILWLLFLLFQSIHRSLLFLSLVIAVPCSALIWKFTLERRENCIHTHCLSLSQAWGCTDEL